MQYVPHFTTFQVGNHFPTPLSFDRKYSNLFYKMWWTSFFFSGFEFLTKTTYIPEIKIYHETCDIWNCVRLPRILCYLFACTYMLVLVLRCQRIKHNHYHWRFLFFFKCELGHTSSVERLSENFDEKALTYLIFFVGTHWFRKCNFWKNSLDPFWGCRGPRGQTTSKLKTTKILNENSLKIDEIQNLASATLKMASWPEDLGRGSVNFSKKYIF